MHVYPLPGIRALSIILFTGLLSGNCCFAGMPEHDSVDKITNPQKEILVYVGYVGRKMIKPLRKTVSVIEVYKLRPEVAAQLNKLQFSPKRYDYKSIQKQQLLLASIKDSCQVYRINSPVKYKYFYPQGLKKGMIISGNEFSHWDFADVVDIKQLTAIGPGKPDSLTAITQATLPYDTNGSDMPENKGQETINLACIKPETGKSIVPFVVSGTKAYEFHPWDMEEQIDSQRPYDPSFAHFADSLFLHISDFSDYLGAQRIKLELFDQHFAADFYSRMYIHYMDSIADILKKNPLIKPGEYENFIINISEIITDRFKYGANTLLWIGIRRDRLDCDNTAYLVYDIGTKLGFEVSVVSVYGHALVVAGDYAYETTGWEYFPKEQLKDHYSTIYWITSNPKKIHAFLSLYELANYLYKIEEYKKADDFLKIGSKYFPGIRGYD